MYFYFKINRYGSEKNLVWLDCERKCRYLLKFIVWRSYFRYCGEGNFWLLGYWGVLVGVGYWNGVCNDYDFWFFIKCDWFLRRRLCEVLCVGCCLMGVEMMGWKGGVLWGGELYNI